MVYPGGRRGRAGGAELGIAGPQGRETVGFPDEAALFGMSGHPGLAKRFIAGGARVSTRSGPLSWGCGGAHQVYPLLVILAGDSGTAGWFAGDSVGNSGLATSSPRKTEAVGQLP